MMFGSWFKVAWRNALGQKLYALINVAGLGVGIACFMLIVLFVRNEFSYESNFENAERIYRVAQEISPEDGSPDIVMATNSPQVAELLKQDYPQVTRAARLRSWNAPVGRDETERTYQQVGLADNEFLRIFDFTWIAGNPGNALDQPAAAVLTASMATTHFGDGEPIGQTLVIGNGLVVTVTGVIADLPPTTHLRFDLLASMPLATSAFASNALINWSSQDYYTYVELAEGSGVEDFSMQLPAFIERHIGEGASAVFSFKVLPIADIHLHSATRNEMSSPGSIAMVYAFIAIAVVILLIACINFMNLATARSNRRAREIGVRKAVGASRWQLIAQFLGESTLLTIAAMLVAIALVEVALPVFNILVGEGLTTSWSANFWTGPFIVVLTALVSLLAGAWPAFHLSAFRPVAVLRGNSDGSGRTAPWFRSALVVLQFAIAVVLLISTFTIKTQIDFVRAFKTGYDIEQIVVLQASGREGLGRRWDELKRELLLQSGVTSVTASNTVPGTAISTNYFLRSEGSGEQHSMPVMLIDYDFFETYGMNLAAGRNFASVYGTDQRIPTGEGSNTAGGTYVINELAARQLGWSPEQAIGKWLEVTCCGFGRGLVVGVVQDVYLESLQQTVAPLIYLIPPEPQQSINSETRLGLRQASVKISAQDISATLAGIDAAWARMRPDQPISRRFLTDDFAALYRSEESQAAMLGAFAGLAILITCLGLYGLSAYNTETRRKEIGVRKVMGSSVWNIVMLLTNDFSRLVLLSNLIAWPVAYLAMSRWLENFAYRIDLTPMIFIGSGLIALCTAWVTVGGTAAKAASAKPVMALRYE